MRGCWLMTRQGMLLMMLAMRRMDPCCFFLTMGQHPPAEQVGLAPNRCYLFFTRGLA